MLMKEFAEKFYPLSQNCMVLCGKEMKTFHAGQTVRRLGKERVSKWQNTEKRAAVSGKNYKNLSEDGTDDYQSVRRPGR